MGPRLWRSAKRTVAPTVRPVSVDEARAAVGIAATTSHDTRLTRLIDAATSKVERDTNRALLKQTWRTKFDYFPRCEEYIELPRPPLMSVSTGGVTYINGSGVTTTWAPANYDVDTDREPGLIHQAYSVDWPDTRTVHNAVTITSIHGYSTASSGVPEDARQAVLMLVDDWFCNPGVDGPMNTAAYDSLIWGLRWGHYA